MFSLLISDIFQMSALSGAMDVLRHTFRIVDDLAAESQELKKSGLDVKKFAEFLADWSRLSYYSWKKFLGATEVLRDTFEEYASKEGEKTMLSIEKFAEICNTGKFFST